MKPVIITLIVEFVKTVVDEIRAARERRKAKREAAKKKKEKKKEAKPKRKPFVWIAPKPKKLDENPYLSPLEIIKTRNTYIAISSTDPEQELTEPNDPVYCRIKMTPGMWKIKEKTIENANAISFPIATVDWKKSRYVAVTASSTITDVLLYNSLATSFEIQSGANLRFEIGDLKFKIT